MNGRKLKWKGALAWLLAWLMVCSVLTPVAIPRKAKAAEEEHMIQIDKNYYETGDTYTMESQSVSLSINANSTGVTWTKSDGNSVNMVLGTPNADGEVTSVQITAIDFGTTTIMVSATDKDGEKFQVSLKVHVGFSVDFGGDFTLLEEEQPDGTKTQKYVLVLNAINDKKDLKLIYVQKNSAYPVTWTSTNLDVFSVGSGRNSSAQGNTMEVHSEGAGKTTLEISCEDPKIAATEQKQTVDVYVLPAVSESGADGSWTSSTTSPKPVLEMESGEGSFFVNTKYTARPDVAASDKIVWAVQKVKDSSIGNGTSEEYQFLKDSLGNVSQDFKSDERDRFSLGTSSDPRQYKAKGVAGKYQLLIYLADTYAFDESTKKPGLKKSFLEETGSKFVPLAINFYITASSKMADTELDISMIAGDSLELGSYFGTSADFLTQLFGVPSVTSNPDLVDGTKLTSQVIAVKPDSEGTLQVTLTGLTPLNDTSTSGGTSWSKLAQDRQSGQTITLNIHISSKFELNITNATVYKGNTLNLSTTLTPADAGATYSWTSSSPSDASVTSYGHVATVEAKNQKEDVKITVVCSLSNGVQRTATCTLHIKDAVDSISFEEKELKLETGGDPKLLKVKLGQSQTGSMNFLWRSSDEKIVTIDPTGDSQSAYINGKNVGTAIVWVENADNLVYATCVVKVYSGVKKIEFIDVTKPVKANKIQKYLQLNLRVTLSDGKTIGLTELNDYNVELLWESGNKSILDITKSPGMVELKSSGTTRLVVTSAVDKLVSDYLEITVGEASTGLSINPSPVTVEKGKTVKLDYVISPADSGADVTWSSLDTKIATVSQNGTVSGVETGQTYIILRTNDGQVATAPVVVTQKASGITLDVYYITVGVGDSYTVTAKPNPPTSSETSFTWSCRDNDIATVKNGVVTGVKAGQTVVLVKSSTGATEYLYVTVQQDVLGMNLNYHEKDIAKGKTVTLKTIFNPKNVSNSKVTWSSSNQKIATVTSKGKVKGIKGGTAVITAVSEDGGFLDYCVVNVTSLTTGIKLNYSSKKLPIKGKVTLKATVSGNTSKTQTLKWTSSDTSIATVSNKGVVTAKSKLGKCVITCKATDGSKEKATCSIRVYRKVTGISLNNSTMKIREGKTARLKATVKPTNATYKSVTWSSSDTDIATIDSRGYVTAIKEGQCKIYATAKDGSKKRATCWLYVLPNIPATAVTLETTDLYMVRGTRSVINYTLAPANSTDSVSFTSNDKSVATVDSNGNVMAKKIGVAYITVRSASGKKALITVTVVGLNKTNLVMEQYDTENLWVEGFSGGSVIWDSSDPNVVSVVGGKVTAKRIGTATITVSVKGIKITCRVTVGPIKK